MSEKVLNQAAGHIALALPATKNIADGCKTLLLEQQAGVLHVTLNRPELRNAMSRQMVAELLQVLRAAQATAGAADAVRVVVLRGAGGHFCAGADLKDMASARLRSMQRAAEPGEPKAGTDGDSNAVAATKPLTDPIAEVNAEFGHLCVAFAQTPLAVVVVLEGTVMGGGLGLACVADVALATHTASFRLPETSIGVVPAQIAPFLVERLGYSQAKRLAVTGGRMDAAAALAVGLVHQVLAPDGLESALEGVLADILACAPAALAATKALMQKARYTGGQDLVAHAAAVFAEAAQSAEGLEGMTAFVQKRKPNWTLT